MKIRTGFVSNSSSCSFIIAKDLLTEKQLKAVKKFISDNDDNPDAGEDGGLIWEESEKYISVDVHYLYDQWSKLIEDEKIDKKNIFYMEA